jgi:CRP-like cAMP-binding protein
MHPFRAFISLYTSISDDDWKIILPCLEYKIIQQNRILVKHGSICKHLYFLENGSIRFFKIEEEIDNTIYSVTPPSIFTAAESFANQRPSDYGIQSTDESYIWFMTREDAYKLLELPAWNKFLSSF